MEKIRTRYVRDHTTSFTQVEISFWGYQRYNGNQYNFGILDRVGMVAMLKTPENLYCS